MASTKLGEAGYYLAAAKRAPELLREEEASLVRRYRAGEERAADLLARSYQRQVVSFALKYRHYGLPLSELIAEGNLGIVHALAKFDPERGVRFGTYAGYWVKAQMLAYVVKANRIVGGNHGPLRSQLFFKLRRERARVFNQFGAGEAADQQLAARLGMTVERVQLMNERLGARDVALDADGRGDGQRVLGKLAGPDDVERDLFEHQVAGSLRQAISDGVARLDCRERAIIEQRLLSDDSECSLAELARGMGISRERARQLETRALHKLRRFLSNAADPIVREWVETEAIAASA